MGVTPKQLAISKVKSFTTTSSKRATTLAGKAIVGGIVQVSKDGFVGLTVQVLSASEIWMLKSLPDKSGGGWVILKLTKSVDPSHIVTSPVSRGVSEVGATSGVEEASAVGDASRVGEAAGVRDSLAAGSVGVFWIMASLQSVRSRSSFEFESDGSASKSKGPATPAGHV
jgi:hypothetical protein